jgi:L-lactate dehydrogenase complex protein LldF
VGITGANFGVSQTGSICLVTNEGNARLVSSLPPVHVVDNGRSDLVGGRTARCSRAFGAVPVSMCAWFYRKTGGAAYGSVYSGPMGAVLAPLLVGLEQARALPHASSLCGPCTDACPVKIPLHELLLKLRADLAEQRLASRRSDSPSRFGR